MKTKKIADAAEQMKQKLFSANRPEKIVVSASGYREYIGKTVTVRLENIVIEENVRREVDQTSPKFLQLVDSIREVGLLQNLVLQICNGDKGEYLSCVSGQRRLLAARIAGLQKAMCLIKEYQAADRVAIGLTENILREDLNCIDIAEGYAKLIENGWSEEQIANHYERGTRTIHRYLIIASWPEDVKEMMREYPDVFSTRVIFNQFVSRGFKSNEELRAAVTAKIKTTIGKDSAAETQSLPENKVQELAKDLTQQMKMKIGIKGNTQKGRIVIDYRNAEEMERVVALIKRFGSHQSLEK